MEFKKKMYNDMLLIRRVEERLKDIFAQGFIPGFIHLSIGQEGVATGVCSCLGKDDYIVSTHRGHGHVLAKGADLKKFMAELFGKTNGYCLGYGGSMHVAAAEFGILGSNGIVGGGIPIAVGAAFSSSYHENKRITVSFIGEGATGTGAFHEALNLASLWKLPILFCCESNQWAEFTPFNLHVNTKNVLDRAKAYNIIGEVIDGNDVLTVYNTCNKLVKKLRSGEGPFFLECKTNRWEGHYVGDPQKYRSIEDKKKSKQNCPIDKMKRHLINDEKIEESYFESCEIEIKEKIDEAVDCAVSSPDPDAQEFLQIIDNRC